LSLYKLSTGIARTGLIKPSNHQAVGPESFKTCIQVETFIPKILRFSPLFSVTPIVIGILNVENLAPSLKGGFSQLKFKKNL